MNDTLPYGGSELDLRWDGGITSATGDQYGPNNYAIAQGLQIAVAHRNTLPTTYQITPGYIYAGTPAGALPTAVNPTPTQTPGALTAGIYWVDIDTTGAITYSNAGDFSSSASKLASWAWSGSEATKKCRIAAMYMDGSSHILWWQDLRCFPGRIDFRGIGNVTLRDLAITCRRTDTQTFKNDVPFVRVTNSLIQIHNCYFMGQRQGNGESRCIDDILHIGGTGIPSTTEIFPQVGGSPAVPNLTAYCPNIGYGSKMVDVFAQQIRRAAWIRTWSNEFEIARLSVYDYCSGESVVDLDAAVARDPSTGYRIGGWAESPYYDMFVYGRYAQSGHTITAIEMVDENITPLASAMASTDTTLTLPGAAGFGSQSPMQYYARRMLLEWGVKASDHTNSEIVTYDISRPMSGTAFTATLTATAGGLAHSVSAGTQPTNGQMVLVGNVAGQQEIVKWNSSTAIYGSYAWQSAAGGYAAGNYKNSYTNAPIYSAPWVLPIIRAAVSATNPQVAHASGKNVQVPVAAFYSGDSRYVQFNPNSISPVEYNLIISASVACPTAANATWEDNAITQYGQSTFIGPQGIMTSLRSP